MSLLLLFQTAGGPVSGETLAAGDLTTAFTKWQASKGAYSNEAVRAALNTAYSQSEGDIQENMSDFLKDRTTS